MTMQIACVVGARPNFMKMAPILRAFEREEFRDRATTTLIHTGQHYDANLSDIFFDELGMRRPDISLEVGSGSHAQQTARVLERIEPVLATGAARGGKFDAVIVVGDVNSTLAAALAGVKLGVRVAHVEAGLRSFDRTMPEEINRLMTDAISDLLLVSEPSGVENLRREGQPEERIALVGNVMIDTLFHMLPLAKQSDILERLELAAGEYGVVTLHRPSNVDAPATLSALMKVFMDVSQELPLVFPMHPRTRQRLDGMGLLGAAAHAKNLRIVEPLGYLPFLALTSQAKVIVTDSGGLQEESTALGIPCLTMRSNTERPVTVDVGTSSLVGSNPALLRVQLTSVKVGSYKRGACPALWDGHAAQRIATSVLGIPSVQQCNFLAVSQSRDNL